MDLINTWRKIMQDSIRNILKDDKKLLIAYEQSEARYLLSLKDDYETIDIDIDLDENEYSTFIKALAKYNMCFDQWALNKLKETLIIEEMKKINEKTCKHSENMED